MTSAIPAMIKGHFRILIINNITIIMMAIIKMIFFVFIFFVLKLIYYQSFTHQLIQLKTPPYSAIQLALNGIT